MVELSSRNARTWSRIGPRAVYGQALTALATENENIIAMSADLGRSSGLDRFSKEYPDQFLNTGIAEQNMVGCAAGLARMGFDVFASTFAPFASMRASEQVRMNMGYMGEPVKLVALGSGLAMAYLGNSHFGLEDVAVMRTVPGLTIISPADCSEIYKTLEACVGFDQPVYIRLTGTPNAPVVYTEDYTFEIGKAVWLTPPREVMLISSGTTVGHCLLAAEKLKEADLNVGVLNMHTIKPLDAVALADVARHASTVFVIEEHTTVGGLGSAILDHYNASGMPFPRIVTHGIPDRFVETGDYAFMLKAARLDGEGIAGFLQEKLLQ
ncbi:transketolase [Rhizobium leguminosarum]|uniref:Transketolase n=1 Tax=Rhizobium leguminosarum TaxID=384 RepID=A0A444IDR1_RHILE|nr:MULTISPECIES: transketolase C-terminal domain-containing protein [Rhizobium]MBY5455772.1 transketolase [Rhizobium leguminosarum]RWX37464.1 transketolase [Rhizobium leguminosarum]TBC87439.1 transketolase [Rhizobium leguminosarum]UIJ84113.1 transketolase [Rhizobium leguminosarum]WSH29855.1 transketolase C-terminal domain-containing protein [Rhizobium beringeri]